MEGEIVDEDGTRWVRQRNADVRLVDGQVYVRQPTLRGSILAKMESVDGVERTLEWLRRDDALTGKLVDTDGSVILDAFTLTEPGFFDRLTAMLRDNLRE